MCQQMYKSGDIVWVRCLEYNFKARLIDWFYCYFQEGVLWTFYTDDESIWFTVIGVSHIVAKVKPLEPPLFIKKPQL